MVTGTETIEGTMLMLSNKLNVLRAENAALKAEVKKLKEEVVIHSCKECSSYQDVDEHGCDDVCDEEYRIIGDPFLIPEWCPKRGKEG